MSSDDIIIIKNIMIRTIIIITIKYEYEYDHHYHDQGYKNVDKMGGRMMIMKYSGLMTTIIMAPAERAKCLLQVFWHRHYHQHHHHHHHHHHLRDISHFNHHFHDDDDDDVRKRWKLGELSSDQKTSS